MRVVYQKSIKAMQKGRFTIMRGITHAGERERTIKGD